MRRHVAKVRATWRSAILTLVEEISDVQFALQWVGDMIAPPAPVNQSMIIADLPSNETSVPEAHVLVLGYVSPPVIRDDISQAELEALSQQPLPVMPAGRFLLSTSKLRELRNHIDGHLARIDAR